MDDGGKPSPPSSRISSGFFLGGSNGGHPMVPHSSLNSHAGDATTELCSWLQDRLHQQRQSVVKQLEVAHTSLINDFSVQAKRGGGNSQAPTSSWRKNLMTDSWPLVTPMTSEKRQSSKMDEQQPHSPHQLQQPQQQRPQSQRKQQQQPQQADLLLQLQQQQHQQNQQGRSPSPTQSWTTNSPNSPRSPIFQDECSAFDESGFSRVPLPGCLESPSNANTQGLTIAPAEKPQSAKPNTARQTGFHRPKIVPVEFQDSVKVREPSMTSVLPSEDGRPLIPTKGSGDFATTPTIDTATGGSGTGGGGGGAGAGGTRRAARLSRGSSTCSHSRSNGSQVDKEAVAAVINDLNKQLITSKPFAKEMKASMKKQRVSTLRQITRMITSGSMGSLADSDLRFRNFVRSNTFEVLSALLVVLNACVLAVQIQYIGTQTGSDLGFRGYPAEVSETWHFVGSTLDALDHVFLTLFVIELLIRFYGYRRKLFSFFWTYFDIFVVVSSVATEAAKAAVVIDPAVARLLRIGKLMRLVRVLRTNAYSLKLLAASIEASFNTLFWSLCVLILIQSVAGMLLAQAVQSYLDNDANQLATRQEIFSYYGTFWRCMVSMFEITFANWGPPCRLLLDYVSEYFGIFFLVYRCAIGFAVINVIQAVFIQQTMKSAQLDDDFVIQEKNREKVKYITRLQRLFEMMDSSGDGFISWEEFEPVLQTEQMRLLLATLDIEFDDLQMLFHLLDDDGGGQISCQEFIEGVPRMKGQAKNLDVIGLIHMCKRIENKVDMMQQKQEQEQLADEQEVIYSVAPTGTALPPEPEPRRPSLAAAAAAEEEDEDEDEEAEHVPVSHALS